LTSITTKCPDGQIAEQVKNAQETLGYQKIIVQKIPPGGGGAIASSKSKETRTRMGLNYRHCMMNDVILY